MAGGDDETDSIELAVAAYREEGLWQLQELPDRALESVSTLVRELRRYPGDNGALGMVAVDEDYFVLVRARGSMTSVLLSDASAAGDWELARSAVNYLGVPVEDDDEPEPAGDLGILTDMGINAMDMAALVDDDELYPDEQLSEIASKLGFGPRFDDLADLAPA